MKYLKMLGLAASAVAVLWAFAGSASATTLTSPAGTTLGVGAKLKLTSTGTSTDGTVNYACSNSTLEANIENAGGIAETVRAPINLLTFTGCTPDTIQVLKLGSFEFHTDAASADGNGRVTWSGAEITLLSHRTVFGFPVTAHCIYSTNNTPIGKVTGSKNREGKEATLTLENAVLPIIGTDASCGESFTWTGSYTFATPSYLDVD